MRLSPKVLLLANVNCIGKDNWNYSKSGSTSAYIRPLSINCLYWAGVSFYSKVLCEGKYGERGSVSE